MKMSIYDIKVQKSDGTEYELSEYRGKPMLIVNTATKCGLSNQFDSLEILYKKYKDEGLVVLGFPSNQFFQEPGNGADAEQACRMSYGVTFPMHEMVKLNGNEAHSLFKYLTTNTKGLFSSKIKWNFTKFLIDKNGNIVKRYATTDNPKEFEEDIKNIINE